MKLFKEVEATRRDYHRDAALNSVHRSSLTVPEIDGSFVEISFLNHFLIKRNYDNVACRVTAVDDDGKRIESRLFKINEPRVYTIPLTGMVEQPVNNYIVEFFAADNLFIPFPAVVVNHRGDNFLNTVHAYNRILNDVFEDDDINAQLAEEASTDVRLDEDADTFAVFAAGPQPCRGDIMFRLDTPKGSHTQSVAIDVPRLTNRDFSLRELFPDVPDGTTGTLRIQQPHQSMFFGRVLAGQRWRDGSFSANHTYYDTSGSAEYWDDNRSSYRVYPFFADFENIIRMYPIMARGGLNMSIQPVTRSGEILSEIPAGPANDLDAPGRFFEVSINELLAEQGVNPEDVDSFALFAQPMNGNTPTRINHQLVYGREALASSVNVSLINPNVFVPPGKTGLAWGQIAVGGPIETRLGVVGNDPGGADSNLEVTFYDSTGRVASFDGRLPGAGGVQLNLEELLSKTITRTSADAPEYVWYTARSDRPDLSAFVVSTHAASGHCTGEHSF